MSEKDEHGCAVGTEKWDEAAQKCVAVEKSAKDLPINEKMVQVMKEYMASEVQKWRLEIVEILKKEKQAIEDELVNSVKAGLGIQKDPVVHLSEVEGVVRKIVLDNAPHGKKTETETGDKPLEGDVSKGKAPDVEAKFNEVIAKKGAF